MRPIPQTPALRFVATALALSAVLVSGCHLAPRKHGRIRAELPLTAEPTDGGTGEPAPARQGEPDKNDRLPDWVIDPSAEGVVGAVGVASKGERSTREQLEEARLSGRMELASMFEVRLQRVGRTEIEEIDQTTGPARDQSQRRNLVTVDRDVVDVVIAGSRQRALWFDPESGECYVWMVLDAKILDKAKQVVVEGVSVLTARDPTASVQDHPPRDDRKEVVPDEPPTAPPKTPETPAEKIEDRRKPVSTIRL